MKAERTHFEKLQVYKLAERLCDEIWTVAKGWDYFSRDTVGRQLVRAADSIGANIAEGTGRGSFLDNRRFIRNARGSLYETRHWLRRAHQRGLLGRDVVAKIRPTIDELSLKLSAYLRSMSELAAKRLETTSQEPERRGRAKNEELRTKN
jgi:four helix bundle protein